MAVSFPVLGISTLSDNGQIIPKFTSPGIIQIADEIENISIKFKQDVSLRQPLLEIKVYKDTEAARCGSNYYMINATDTSWFISFSEQPDIQRFSDIIKNFKSGKKNSLFAQRTDDASATQYFQFYGYLSQQQNMMQDYIRTSTYQRAIHSNLEDFKDKVVLDVGAGSGILSFFAQQARAKKVYAVEASSMAKHAETLVFNNKKQDTIVVIPGKIEEITLPEMVDVIISEPMGYMLFNERMLETYLHAKKWLKPNGKMFPTQGDLHIAPFSDAGLYMEQLNKANFWYQLSFHGVDLSSLRDVAAEEYFKQPIVDTFDIRICTAKSVRHTVNFLSASETDLHRIEIPLHFHILQTADIHGLAFWFDVAFIGSKKTLWLSTSPTQPLTHWYQVRCLLATPLFAERGQIVTGHVLLISNKRQSYDVDIELCLEGSTLRSQNTLDLKNPFFRYSGQAPQPPPGTNETSPSEAYWQTLGMTNGTDMVLTNGVNTSPNASMTMVNGTGDMMDVTHHLAAYPPQQPTYNLGSLPSPGAMKNSASAPPSSQRVAAPVSAPSSSIGGGISPSLFSQQHQQVVMGHTSHFPVSNNLMIGDYVTPGNNLSMHTSIPPYKP